MADVDVLVVGAGPAGLAVAIGLALRGLCPTLIDGGTSDGDKACGEGLMAPGRGALERLGIPTHALGGEPVSGVCYIDGPRILPLDFGREQALGLRRLKLSAALRARAQALGIGIRRATLVDLGQVDRGGRTVQLQTPTNDGGATAREFVHARFVVGADGLRSRIRRLAGLEAVQPRARRRFALRQHLLYRPWSSMIEVHLGNGLEAYVTPIGPHEINVAFLSDRPLTTLAQGLCQFPTLAARIGASPSRSRARGAGPLAQATRAVCAPHVALVGDASGYVDANTGEGLSLALLAAESLAMRLSRAVADNTCVGVAGYAPFVRRLTRRYRMVTRSLLWLGRHPRLRRVLLRLLVWLGGNRLLMWATALHKDPAIAHERPACVPERR